MRDLVIGGQGGTRFGAPVGRVRAGGEERVGSTLIMFLVQVKKS